MKKPSTVMLAVIAVCGAIFLYGAVSPAVAADEASSNQTILYYFHGSFRCPTCRRMETYARAAAEKNFKDALASGKLAFKAVNVEDRGNEHYVGDYQLYTKSLILSRVRSGREVESRNLDKIWTLVGNKQKFMDYVSSEISDFMKGVE